MPYSLLHAISDICRYILVRQPKSILDIEAGFGSFGALARLYTDIWHTRYDQAQWKTKIVGVDRGEGIIPSLGDR